MKNLLLLLILLVPLVYAADLNPTVPRFSVIVKFSEDVNVVDSKLIDSDNNLVTNITTTTITQFDEYNFTTQRSVPNGNYDLEIIYTSKDAGAGSSRFSETVSLTVFSAGTQNDFDIRLVQPPQGFQSRAPPFPLVFETDESANCLHSFFQPVGIFDPDNSNGIQHIINYVWPESERDIWLVCTSNEYAGRQAAEVFTVGFITGTPAITSVSQSPMPLKDPIFRDAILTINTVHDSQCILEHSSTEFPSSVNFALNLTNPQLYSKTNEFKICFDSECDGGLAILPAASITDNLLHNYPINITCMNLAQEAVSTSFNAQLQLTYSPNLNIISPKTYENRTSFDIEVRSPLGGMNCEYSLDGGIGVLTENPANTYKNAVSNLAQGTHQLDITCRAVVGVETATRQFIIDNQPPSDFSLSIPAQICEGQNLLVNWSATDSVTGVEDLRYQIIQNNNVVSTGSLESTGSVSYTWNSASSYSINAYVVDKAGNVGSSTSKTFSVKNASDIECDSSPPKVRVYQRSVGPATNFWLRCQDDESSCVSEFGYNLEPGSNKGLAECTYNITGTLEKNITATKTSVLCYEVLDSADNVVKGKEVINVDQNLTFCLDGIKNFDESDIDCGGSCSKCAVNFYCANDADCISSNCNALGICDAEAGCFFDSECPGGECNRATGECIDAIPRNRTPGGNNTGGNNGGDDDDTGFNWLALAMSLIGISLVAGGALYYLKPAEVKPAPKTGFSAQKPKAEDFKITPRKLDIKEKSEVHKMRNKLETGSKKRRSLLSTFESKTDLDKEKPAVTEKPKTEQKKLDPKPVKKEQKKKQTKKKKPKQDYIEIKHKKDDVFEELDEI